MTRSNRHPSALEVVAPAKINLRLVVLERDVAGYHAIETLFCGISLADRITIIPVEAPEIRLEVAGTVDTGSPDDNLAVRAARAFERAAGIEVAVALRLEKRIPSAAGLGGGSSDAAATLRGLDLLYPAAVDPDTLLRLGAELGSDVPFFLSGTPYAFAWSRGERLLELRPLPSRPVLIANPGIPLPTGPAFRELAQLRSERRTRVEPIRIDAGAITHWDSVKPLATNDLDEVARISIPTLSKALDVLKHSGAEIALLAGSGASIFGIFGSGSRLDSAEEALRRLGWSTWRCETLARWPEVRTRD